MSVARWIGVVPRRCCHAIHLFHCKTEQLGNLRDTKSAQQTTHNLRLTFIL